MIILMEMDAKRLIQQEIHIKDLIPEMSHGKHSNSGVLAFAFGFSIMMALDVALGRDFSNQLF